MARFNPLAPSEKLLLMLLFFAFAGRFYYLVWGFEGHLQPSAPTWVIILRELPLVGVIVVALLAVREISADTAIRLVGVGLLFVTAVVHLPDIGGAEWTQHYLRNILLPLFAITVIGLVTPGARFWSAAIKVLQSFCLINALISILAWEFDISLHGGRVIGLAGDPIANSGISVIGIAVALYYQKGMLVKAILVLLNFAAFLVSLSVTYVLCLLLIPFFWRFRLSLAAALVAIILSLPYVASIYNAMEESEIPLIIKVLERIDPDTDVYAVEGRLNSYRAMFDYLVDGSSFELLAGSLSGFYFKADAMLAGLLLNNGFVGLFGFMLFTLPSFLAGRREFKTSGRLSNLSKAMLFMVVVFFVGGLANNNLYKYPLNIMCLMAFVYFSSPRQAVYEIAPSPSSGIGGVSVTTRTCATT